MSENTNVVLFSVWTMNGGILPASAQTRIERAIERVVKDLEDKDGLRLLTSTTNA